jgi:hypothetical protein
VEEIRIMRARTATCLSFIVLVLAGCSSDSPVAASSEGGATGGGSGAVGASGGQSSGGTASGGVTSADASSGGTSSGGKSGAGGASTGGAGTGGAPNGDTYLPWEGGNRYYEKWSAGPTIDSRFFPIAVWLQSPARANDYKAIGVNLFIGLWEGPTTQQLTELTAAGVPTICEQQAAWSSNLGSGSILGWMHQDEPDNAQPDGNGGYGPCISAATIVSGYQTRKAADPSRPIYLNLGRGVADDEWVGRGSCSGTSDYADYAKGADILSFDVYPVNDDLPISLVATGMSRLREWSRYEKPVWMWIETTGFNSPSGKPTPAQVKAEVWLALVHGARGIGYFAHVFEPSFIEAGLLADATMASAVKAQNAQIKELAIVLDTQSLANAVTVTSANDAVHFMAKRYAGDLYVFAVSERNTQVEATFTLRDTTHDVAGVIDENRDVSIASGVFKDGFAPYAVHLYRVRQ